MRFTLIVTALVGMAAFANADQPSPGTYLIVNRVASPTGQSLAATFEGGQTKLTVTPLTGSSAQLWIITLGEQFIIPVNDQTKAATATGNLVVALPKNGFVWTINNATSQYYTIADQSQLWSLNNPANDADIVLDSKTGGETQDWVLHRVG